MSRRVTKYFLLIQIFFVATILIEGNCYEIILEQQMQTQSVDERIFLNILKKFDYLSLNLNLNLNVNLNRYVDAAANKFVEFLLKQTICPLKLTRRAIENKMQPIYQAEQRHRAVVIYSDQLDFVLNNYATKMGYFICILLNEPDEMELLQLAQRLWHEKWIYKVYYFTPNKNLFFSPYGAYGPNATTKSNAKGLGAIIVAQNNRLITDELFYNLRGSILRLHIFDSVYSKVTVNETANIVKKASGADYKVAELLSKVMNFKMLLQMPDEQFFGARLPNGSYDGAIGRLIRDETDFTPTGFFVKDYLTRDIEFSVSIYMDDLCCYVQKAKRVPQSILPLFAVNVDMWLVFFIIGFTCPIIWIIIRQFNLNFNQPIISDTKVIKFPKKTQYWQIFNDTWVLWVRVGLERFPPFHSERIFIISLCLVSVIYGAIFESSLATVYIRPLYYKDINTLQELDEVNIKIHIKHAAIKDDLFFGHNSTIFKNLDKKTILVRDMKEERLIDKISNQGQLSGITRSSSLFLNDIRYLITNKIHKIPECPKIYHIAYLFPKDSPFEGHVNILLLKFVEAGLINQWIEETKHKHRISIYKFPEVLSESSYRWKILTINDLQLAFYTIVFGSLLAAIVVTLERRYKKSEKKF